MSARLFVFFFFVFCVGVVVYTVGFYTQLYHLRLTFFRWENAVEMFVIYTLCCPIVFLFASLRFLLCLCLLYKCNSMDSIKMNVESKINKIASPFCARFDFSFVSWWEKVDDTMRCDALRYDTRSFGLALCDGQLFCCCSSFLFFFLPTHRKQLQPQRQLLCPGKNEDESVRVSQSAGGQRVTALGWSTRPSNPRFTKGSIQGFVALRSICRPFYIAFLLVLLLCLCACLSVFLRLY